MQLAEGQANLPPLYQRWMTEMLVQPVPAEEGSTCHDCPMCSSDSLRNRSGIVFDSSVKCCTFWPALPNFLVGKIFADDSPEFLSGRAAFETQFCRTLVVNPLGVNPPESYQQQYTKIATKFGTDTSLRCPYYLENERGKCGIWKHRNARCASWFCRFNRGSTSVVFWKYLDVLLTGIEKALSRYCVLQLDPGEEALQLLFPPHPVSYKGIQWRHLWGKWWGKERDFFKQCAQIVEALSWTQTLEIAGAESQVHARIVRDNFHRLSNNRLPAALKRGDWKKVVELPSGEWRVWTYNIMDPVDLPPSLLQALSLFEGKSCEAGKQEIAEKGIQLDDEQLRKLTDIGILVPA